MAETVKTKGRFAALRDLQQKADGSTEVNEENNLITEPPSSFSDGSQDRVDSLSNLSSSVERSLPRTGPGRPRGRRSNPDYTQISAYIPLDLLLAIQGELEQERRLQRQRSGVNVSELVESLLTEWLNQRKIKKSE